MENLQSALFKRAASRVARPIWIGEGPAHLILSAQGRTRGGSLPHRHRWLAGKIRSASGRWSAVEWPGSKLVWWQTGLVAK
jgi:hypothetical protein